MKSNLAEDWIINTEAYLGPHKTFKMDFVTKMLDEANLKAFAKISFAKIFDGIINSPLKQFFKLRL